MPQNAPHWHLQRLNVNGLTAGPPAVSDPASLVCNDQTHIYYRDSLGKLYDSWYDVANRNWSLQQINLGELTAGPAAVGKPSAFFYNNQSHVLYRDSLGRIHDSWYDFNSRSWNLQQINQSGLTDGPAAVNDPASLVYLNQSHVLYSDAEGKIQDSWYDPVLMEGSNQRWHRQGINYGYYAAVGDPAAAIYGNQSHILYRESNGNSDGFLKDAWFDGGLGDLKWHVFQVNLSGPQTDPAFMDSLTDGPAAVGNPAAFAYLDQFHILYRDADGKIQDVWNAGQSGDALWHIQQINLSGLTGGPAAVGNPAAYVGWSQSHVLYRDAAGKIHDSWYDTGDGGWHLQGINIDGVTSGPAAVGDVSAFVFRNQAHVLYRDAAGEIWDSWYEN